ncbi:hypothetical protein Nepgr_014373 [Nepenthes gracilis]|uniref:Uncharacterized protein n=1 Tax=Nepenthes gracilis TaxID=150966 RepID=A0AAD3SJX6_NEPGR|nr:hypothetical protein Nepgr_014373 [Nepenthes gracilis]
MRHSRAPCQRIAPAVTIRTAVPVYSAPPLPPPHLVAPPTMRQPSIRVAPPVCTGPVHAVPSPVQKEDLLPTDPKIKPAEKSEATAQDIEESEVVPVPADGVDPKATDKTTRELEGVEKKIELLKT